MRRWHTTTILPGLYKHTHTQVWHHKVMLSVWGHLAASWVCVCVWGGVTSPERSVTTLTRLAEHRPPLSMNWKQEGMARWWWLGAANTGRKLRPLLQAQELLKFQGPPTPLSSAGTATHTGKKGDEMWGKYGSNGGLSSTRITGGIVHCQNKLKFLWITVHEGLQVCAGVRSADTRFPVKREQPNEGRGRFMVAPSWQFLRWVNAGAVQARQCVLHKCQTKADDTQHNVWLWSQKCTPTAVSADILQRRGPISSCLTSSSDFFSDYQSSTILLWVEIVSGELVL